MTITESHNIPVNQLRATVHKFIEDLSNEYPFEYIILEDDTLPYLVKFTGDKFKGLVTVFPDKVEIHVDLLSWTLRLVSWKVKAGIRKYVQANFR